jgi:beta-lactamase superfamily II metal-dependent hydrolase
MLWDCGSSHAGLGLRELPRAVREVGGMRVRSALVTHANLDHFLCLPDVAPALGIERVYTTRSFIDAANAKPHGAAAALLAALHAQGIAIVEVAAHSSIRLGGATCEFISPSADSSFTEEKDESLVGLFRVPTAAGERRLLMTGDIGPLAIVRLRRAFPDLHAHAMELPHHGSAKPEAFVFVRDIDPIVVLQSTGPQRVGDPRWDGVRAGRTWGVTARDGALTLEIGKDGHLDARSLRHGLDSDGGFIPAR